MTVLLWLCVNLARFNQLVVAIDCGKSSDMTQSELRLVLCASRRSYDFHKREHVRTNPGGKTCNAVV
jgi:hypothetical protein